MPEELWGDDQMRAVRVVLLVVAVMSLVLIMSGCDSSERSQDSKPQDAPMMGYAHLVPSLPTVNRLLGGSGEYLLKPALAYDSIWMVCPALDSAIEEPLSQPTLGWSDEPGGLVDTPSFRGMGIKFWYGDLVSSDSLQIGMILVARSPITDVRGVNYDFMGLARDYPCFERIKNGLMLTNELADMADQGVPVTVALEGIPPTMIGYRSFTIPALTDPAYGSYPVYQMSVPVASLTQQSLVEVFSEVDGYFIRVQVEGYSPDPDLSTVSLDQVISLVNAVEDRVRENHIQIEEATSPGTCRDLVTYLWERDFATSNVVLCPASIL